MIAFRRATWALILFNLAVFAWGALVRATGSGAGCGQHWPTCNGEVIPTAPALATLIELTHRATSGLALALTAGFAWWARKVFPPASPGRRSALAAFVLICMEALIGAILVLAELTGTNESVARAVMMGLHLLNTFLLLAAFTLTAWWAEGGAAPRLRGQLGLASVLGVGALALAVSGSTGAIAALGDALFPAHDLASALQQDLDGTAHLLLRLRILHPILALNTAGWLLLTALVCSVLRPGRAVWRAAALVAGGVLLQGGLGFANVLLLAPVWLQCVHLIVAESLWMGLVWLALTALSSADAARAR